MQKTDTKLGICFVVMGFGKKTDYQSKPQRVLDLDKTFENIIKPAIDEAGLSCIRADEIIHNTYIDKPMYEQLHQADIVIADLSTSNANAIYELGVRHALRPHATIVMVETNFKFPFDLNHVSILTYRHLGEDIGASEAKRVKELLKAKLAKIKAATEVDSPVYLFLPSLAGIDVAPAEPAAAKTDESLAEMRERLRKQKEAVRRPADWLKVIATLHEMEKLQPNDPFVTQQLALATYKSEYPDKATSLRDAKEILYKLLPTTSSDAETVGLWGAIHKRLWEVDSNRADLDKAINAYSRGFCIKNDYYNGINFAFLLDVRATLSKGDEAVGDRVLAKRVRCGVLADCQQLLTGAGVSEQTAELLRPIKREQTIAEQTLVPGELSEEARFWIEATMVEALVGLGWEDKANTLQASMLARKPPPWIIETMDCQVTKLRKLLKLD